MHNINTKRHGNFKDNQNPISLDDLPVQVQKRFLEIEIRLLEKKLHRLYHFSGAKPHIDTLISHIMGISPYETIIHDLMEQREYKNPPKNDIVDMLRYNHVSVAKIRKIVRMSPNDIVNRRFITPGYEPGRLEIHPLYPHWSNEHRIALNHIRSVINYFE